MASTAAFQRDVLTFDNGRVYDIALKYGTGKQVSNGRIMFSTTDGEVFFLDADDADKIYALNLDKQEKFRLLKSRAGIEVQRIAGRQAMEAPAAPRIDATENAVSQPPQPQNNSLSGIMAASYISAIDALKIAQDYAEKHGVSFKISTMELRSCAHSIFIAATKNGVTR